MAKVFLLTGLSGAGKTTLATALQKNLQARMPCALLDGDQMRGGINRDLGFSAADRAENLRRCGEIAKLLADQGITVILALIAPYQKLRDDLKELIGADRFHVIHVDCPLEICMLRDPKKNYKKAKNGGIANYTGLGDCYETPGQPDLLVQTSRECQADSIGKVVNFAIGKIAAASEA